MTFVYLLSDHDEYGSVDVRATLNREALPEMLKAGWGDHSNFENAMTALRALLATEDVDLAKLRGCDRAGASPHNLMSGWGGPQLHVVPVEG